MTKITIQLPSIDPIWKSVFTKWANENCVSQTIINNYVDDRGYVYLRRFEITCLADSDATLIALKWQ